MIDLAIGTMVLVLLLVLIAWSRRYAFPPMRQSRNPLFERTYEGGMHVSDLQQLAVELDEDPIRDPVIQIRRSKGRAASVTSVRGTRGGDVIFGSEEWPA